MASENVGTEARKPVVTAEQAIAQCLVWYGMGTGGVPTRQAAVDSLVSFFTDKFRNAIKNDPRVWTDEDDLHRVQRQFILRCAEAIGRLAAQLATKDGVLAITVTHVEHARDKVVSENGDPNPGDFCN